MSIRIRNIDEGNVSKSYVNRIASKLQKGSVLKDKATLQQQRLDELFDTFTDDNEDYSYNVDATGSVEESEAQLLEYLDNVRAEYEAKGKDPMAINRELIALRSELS